MEYKKGQSFLCNPPWSGQRELIIMAIEQKYIMCRFKGYTPFVKSVKDFTTYLESMEAEEIITKNK